MKNKRIHLFFKRIDSLIYILGNMILII